VLFRTLSRCRALCVLPLLTISCGASDSQGELRNGSFRYRCVNDRDPMCSLDTDPAKGYLEQMPGKVAVGASFGVAFMAESSAAQDGAAVLASVSERFLAATSGVSPVVFTAQRPGVAGVLANRGSTIVDVFHFLLVDVDHVRIDASESVVESLSSVKVGVGSLLTLSAAAADASDEVLAGSLDDAWTSDDPAIATLVTSPATDTITLRGGVPGQTWVRATLGGVEGRILVQVVDSGGGSGGAGGAGEAGGAGGSGGDGGAQGAP
jgi:hypothetical protein